ncbi:MAG: hypothetical protein D6731_24815 [Planctomycetota bacterium]|nr:MAG: hypothetical protein D6731_24815 [Planctomycetota bacterium]
MHTAFRHLARRIGTVYEQLESVAREVEQQSERETKLLERVEYGDDFDEHVAPVQEEVVAALAEALELLDEARDRLERARQTLADVESL